jgi:hypothetical protein
MDSVKTRRILNQIALLNLGHVPNEDLVARLHYLVEDDPVCFPILNQTVNRGGQGMRGILTNISELG